MAGESLVFTRAFAHNPVTLPSHANILTGATSLYHGVSDNTGFKLDRKFLTIPQYLRRSGYATAAFIGAFPLDSRFGLDQGFDVYDDYYGTRNEREFFFVERPAEKVIAPAMAWIGKQSGKWFGWVHLFDPHQPYLPPSPFKEQYADDPYSGEVAYVDSQLGVLFDFLRARRLLEKTVVIVTADHGEALGEKGEDTHSYFAYNNTIHVPLFVHIPGRKPGTFAGNVCHADIFPTLCAVLGLKVPPHVQGESLLAIMAAGKRQIAGNLFRIPDRLAEPRLGAPARLHLRRQQVHRPADQGSLRPGQRHGRRAQPGRQQQDRALAGHPEPADQKAEQPPGVGPGEAPGPGDAETAEIPGLHLREPLRDAAKAIYG